MQNPKTDFYLVHPYKQRDLTTRVSIGQNGPFFVLLLELIHAQVSHQLTEALPGRQAEPLFSGLR